MVPAPAIQTIPSHDGLSLHAQSWRSHSPPARAALVIVHGVGEHCDRYSNVVNHLLPLGIDIHSWDHRGHGRSAGRRGHVNRWTDYTADLRTVLAEARSQHAPGIPLFVFAHSMGALIALDAAVDGDLDTEGLIVSGVPLQPAGVAKPHLIFLTHLLSRIWPTFAVRLPFSGEALTSDPAELGKLQQDKNGHHQMTVRWGKEALNAIQRIHHQAATRLTLPLLVLHGGRDTVNLAAGSEWLLAHAASKDKYLHIYPQTRHEPHNDIERDAMLKDLSDWLLQRLPTESPPPPLSTHS